MKKIQLWLKKNWIFVGFLLTALLDNELGVLEKFISDEFYRNLIKTIGSITVAWFWTSPKNKSDIEKNQFTDKE